MVQVMKKKLSKKKGFTLAELLIVVAIIAVLVAISIPVFGSALTKANDARDLANVRAAYAELLVEQMTEANFGTSSMSISLTKSAIATKSGVAESKFTVDNTDKVIKVGTAGSFKYDDNVSIT